MRQIDPNQVFRKENIWDCELNMEAKQKTIEIPKFTVINNHPNLISVPPTYIHMNIVYPDENHYSCDEDDLQSSIDPQMIQQLDIRKNLNNTRNYCPQYELLNSLDYPSEYYDTKVEKLGRPLLRVFMRGHEDDYRMNIAFRPSRAYKQKRQKRLNLQLQEFQVSRQITHTENLIALHLFQQIKQRELLKLEVIKQEATEFANTFDNCTDLFNQLKDLRVVLREEEPGGMRGCRKVFEQCADQECSYQFQSNQIANELIEFMDEQYSNVKEKNIHWPKQPTLLTDWNIENYTNLGVHQQNQQLVYTTQLRTLFIMDRTKKNKKKVKLMLVDRNRASVFDGVRAEFEHFYSHFLKIQSKTENQFDQQRKEIQKIKQERIRKEQMLKLQQKREEQRKSLKIKLKLIKEEPKIIKTVKIKSSNNLKFCLINDDSTRISLRQQNWQVVLK